MKTKQFYFNFLVIITVLIIASCASPISMTSWKNPADNTKLKKVVVMPLFEKLEYIKPFEQSMCAYFNSKGLKSIGSLEFLNPNIKYPIADIKKKCDSLGADAILVFLYQGTDKTENYVPETTYVTGGYGGYWGGGYWGGGFYGGYYGSPYYGSTVSTGGYWTTTKVVSVKASLYTHVSKKEGMWTAEIQVTDPQYIDQVADNLARNIYTDWQKDGMLVSPGK
jgi:hypothetical protein